MRNVVVVSTETRDEFDDIKNWVIDDDDRLHIVGHKMNRASYNKGAWLFVIEKS